VETRNLGSSGLRVSVVGLGCNNFGGRIDLEATRRVVHKAIDLGITLLDTADIYGNQGGSEDLMGQVMGAKRKNIVLATKYAKAMDSSGEMQGGSRRYIMNAVEASLKRLKTDWIDLYQMHETDPRTPIEETLRALDDLIRQGKVRYVGCSNFPAWEVVEALWTSKAGGLESFVACQDEYSLLVRGIDKSLMPVMQKYNLGLLPFFPLASGLLTGKYKQGAPMPEGARLTNTERLANVYITEANWKKVGKLEAFAQARGHTMLELAFSWLACRPCVSSVIAGATKPEQLEQNIKAAGWKLTAEEMAEIDTITLG
jgi:aryl-alcohol dehydrogenase-like predicted oxidoreductase